MKDWIKRVYLRWVIGYKHPEEYWDRRWKMGLEVDKNNHKHLAKTIRGVMEKHGCKSILEVGCGANPLGGLPGYLGADFSDVGLHRSCLLSYLHVDITDRIPLPSQSFDAVYSGAVLMHIPPNRVSRACSELKRVARKCIILKEPNGTIKQDYHQFSHDLKSELEGFRGSIVWIT